MYICIHIILVCEYTKREEKILRITVLFLSLCERKISKQIRLYDSRLLTLTLKVIRLSVHEDVVDEDDAEDAGPQMQVTEDEHEANILFKNIK